MTSFPTLDGNQISSDEEEQEQEQEEQEQPSPKKINFYTM